MVKELKEMTNSFFNPLLLSEGYSTTTYRLTPKTDSKKPQQQEGDNLYTPFLQELVKEVGNLPLVKRKRFTNLITQVASGVAVGALAFGVHSLTKPLQAEATGLNQLMPYLQQKTPTTTISSNMGNSFNTLPTTTDATIPVNGKIMDQITQLGILPVEIVDMLVDIVITCGILGVLLAMVCLMIAGGFRMMGNLERAKKWSVDVVKGLGQILLAPVIIILLALITSLALGGIEGLDLFY